eukprot:1137092-Pelagomonas_calceolata.AAC.1
MKLRRKPRCLGISQLQHQGLERVARQERQNFTGKRIFKRLTPSVERPDHCTRHRARMDADTDVYEAHVRPAEAHGLLIGSSAAAKRKISHQGGMRIRLGVS